jgi:beta-glucosidase
VATLYHWDLPLSLQERGGWRSRETAYAFTKYTDAVAARLGDRVTRWITLNEPWCSAYLGHGSGVHAPGLCDMQAAVDSGHHLLLAHGLAVQILRERVGTHIPIGITLNLMPIYASDTRQETRAAQDRLDHFHNRWFLDPIFRGAYPEHLFATLGAAAPPVEPGDSEMIAAPLDFLGVNYYSRLLVAAAEDGEARPDAPPGLRGFEIVGPVPGSQYTEMGWEVYPDGLVDLLIHVQRDYQPRAILVTENGSAFDDVWDGSDRVRDESRLLYLRKHLEALAVARMLGVRVDGYFVWSLLDNFEWAEGYLRRFGIVYVDYGSQRRIIKDSGRWYADFVAAHRHDSF